MNLENIEVNTQSSIRINLDKIVYFDPFKIKDERHDADIIFITHSHHDHMDIESIDNIKNEDTIIVAPKSMEKEVRSIVAKEYMFLSSDEEIKLDDISIKAIPAYNILKPFHPKRNGWLGYIITYNNITYYIAGDTDKTKESENVKCDVALIPIGGYYTMNVNDASELIKIIKPQVVIPIHYGSIVGNIDDGKKLKELLSDTNIEVVEKLMF